MPRARLSKARSFFQESLPQDLFAKPLSSLFPTRFLISPSYEALLPDISPENIEALYKAAQAFQAVAQSWSASA